MAEQTPPIVAAADDLVTALGDVRRVEGVPRGGGLDDLWPDLAGGCLARWGVDLRRTVARSVEALATARAARLTDEGVDAVERATWRLAGARDKLRAIISLALGVSALRLDRPGVRFAADHRKIARHLEEIGSDTALRLRDLFDQIAEHPAIVLRNQISHSLAPLPDVAEVCWIDVAILDDENSVIGWDTSKRLFPENVLGQGSLEPEAIYDFATTAIEDAQTLIAEAISAAATIITAHGRLHPPYPVYRDTTGRLHVERPPGLDWWSRQRETPE